MTILCGTHYFLSTLGSTINIVLSLVISSFAMMLMTIGERNCIQDTNNKEKNKRQDVDPEQQRETIKHSPDQIGHHTPRASRRRTTIRLTPTPTMNSRRLIKRAGR